MSDLFRFPTSSEESFSSSLDSIIEEFEAHNLILRSIAESVADHWKGQAQQAFSQEVNNRIQRLRHTLDSIQYVKGFFSGTVRSGLHELLTMENQLGSSFGEACSSGEGTVQHSKEGNNLSTLNKYIDQSSGAARSDLATAISLLQSVTVKSISTGGISSIKGTLIEKESSFANLSSAFQSYSSAVESFRAQLTSFCSGFEVPADYQNMSFAQASSLIWYNHLFESCMSDDRVWMDILSKKADEISPEEYSVLANVYLTMEPEMLAAFLKKCSTDIASLTPDPSDDRNYVYMTDMGKISPILAILNAQYSAQLYLLREFDNGSEESMAVQENMLNIAERKTLLYEYGNLGMFYGNTTSNWDNEPPFIKVEANSNGGLIFSHLDKLGDNGLHNIEKHTVTIDASPPSVGSLDVIQNCEALTLRHFGFTKEGFAESEIIDIAKDKAIGQAIEAVKRALEKKGIVDAIGIIPIVGDIASVAVDCVIEINESNVDMKYLQETFQNISYGNVLSQFDYNIITVTRDDQVVLYAEPGRATQARIDAFSSLLHEDSSTPYQFISSPEELLSKIYNRFVNTGDPRQEMEYYNITKIEG